MDDTHHCVLCGRLDSWRHALIECSLVRCVWALAESELVEKMVMTTEPHAKQWLFTMFNLLSHVECTEMVVTLWSIWYAQRKAIYDYEFQSPQATHGFIMHYKYELDVLIKCKPGLASATARKYNAKHGHLRRQGVPSSM